MNANMQWMSLDSLWQEALAYYLEHWGGFSTGILVAEPLDADGLSTFRRSLELDGCILCPYGVDAEKSQALYDWLESVGPSLWGESMNLARIAMLLHCSTPLDFSSEQSKYSRLAGRFPFPILFHFTPEMPWKTWLEKNRFLFGREVLVLGGQL